MKKVFKRIGVGVVFFLILAISVLFICMAYLFLYPKGEIFGIVYCSENSSKVYTVEEYDSSTLKEIELTSTRFDIVVQADDNLETIRAYVKSKVSGFCKKENSSSELKILYNRTEQKVALETCEPTGWIGASGSYVKLHIPKALMESGLKLKLNTAKKSNIEIYGEEYSKLSELNVKINRGKLYFDGLESENIIIKANKAKIWTGDKVCGVTKYMGLDIGKSEVNLLYAGNGAKYLSKTIPEESKIDYKVENLCIKNAEKNSLIRLFNCDYLYSDTGCVLSGGEIKLYYLGKANLDSKNLNLSIYKLTNTSQDSDISFSGKGDLSITENYSPLNVVSNSGEINIGVSDAVMVLETVSGKINVENARKKLALVTNSGSANVNFAKDAEDGEYAVEREIISLRTKNGKVNINNVEKLDVVVDDGGKANINIFYSKVVGKSNFEASNSNLQIVVPKNEAVTLDVEGKDAYVKSDVGTATRENKILNGSYLRHAYGTATGNILKILSSGSVVLMSDDIYELKK